MKKSINFRKTAIVIMIITLLSKILGFGRDVFLSYFFGASEISDAYLISLTIPTVIFGFIAAGIVTAYIPMQSRIIEESGEDAASKYTSNFTNIILLIVTIFLIVALPFTKQIVQIFAYGFSGETLNIAIEFTRVAIFGMYFSALITIFTGYLQVKNKFIIPAVTGFPLNLIVIVSIYYAAKGNYIILALGTLLATSSALFLMLPFIIKEKFKYKFIIDFKDEKVRKSLFIALPVMIGASVDQVNVLIDKTMASSIAVGGVSSLNYANKLNLFMHGIIVASIITVIYPLMSSYATKSNLDGVKKVITESISVITILILPITMGTMIFSKQIIVLLFGRGAFDASAIQMTSIALFYYSIGMIGFGFRDILTRGFYSLQDTKTPVINSAIGVLANIILNIILSRYLGIGGLALATSISAILTTILLFISLRKKIGPFGMQRISISFIKILIASVVMGVFAKLSFNYLSSSLSQNLALLLSVGVGSVTYFVIIYFMKIEDVDIIVGVLKTKFGKGAT